MRLMGSCVFLGMLLARSLSAKVLAPSARELFAGSERHDGELVENQARLVERADELERQAAAAPPPTARELAPRFVEDGPRAGAIVDPAAERASALTFDAWAGYVPRTEQIKLGLAWAPSFARLGALRGQLQVGENVIGPAVGVRLPLGVFAEALSLSVGGALLWDTQRREWVPSVYVARLVF